MLHIISNERDLRQFRTARLPKFRAAQAEQGFRGVRPRLVPQPVSFPVSIKSMNYELEVNTYSTRSFSSMYM